MERLLNLLQEFYGENRKFSNDDGLLTMTNGVENLSGAYAQTYIISLKGGFIKWLVENDKILETEVRPIQIYDYEGKYCDNEFGYSWFNQGLYYRVIMELSISDTPIDFLCSILK